MSLRHRQLVLSLIILALGTTLPLSGCGQKGGLYMPEQDQQDQHDQQKEERDPKSRNSQ